MAKENDIKEELLKQMEKDSDKIPEADTTSSKEIIAKDLARIKRLKWVTICSWLLAVALFIVGGIIENAVPYPGFPSTTPKAVGVIVLPTLVVVLKALILISVFFTISLYVRSRTLTIKQIHIRLINIEEHLKKISQEQ
jgi:phosphatidylserine synthase